MDKIIIEGGARLQGTVRSSGAKNAALPLLAATLLTDQECILSNVPQLRDIRTIDQLLTQLGSQLKFEDDNKVTIKTPQLSGLEAPYELVKTMRASVLVLGSLLARAGKAKVSLPGGCAIGARPINLHLNGLQKLGAEIYLEEGYIIAEAHRLRGAKVTLDLPTVTGTENLIMAAVFAEGQTIIENAAREPEIDDLVNMLNKMGAKIQGIGSAHLVIDGVGSLSGTRHTIIPDRIETGTLMLAAAITHGNVEIMDCRPDHLISVTAKLREAGIEVEESADSLKVINSNGRWKAVSATTAPYPGFPTDMQAQWMAFMSLANGASLISETVFENRFMHVLELDRMGADISIEGHTAIVRGVEHLSGAPVMATDLRASASLILAGLAAQGETEVSRIYHLDRGYEHLENKLALLGAKIKRVKAK